MFVVQSSLLRSARRRSDLAFDRRLGDGQDQFCQFDLAIFNVSALITVPLAGDLQVSLLRNPLTVSREKTFTDVGWKRRRLLNIPNHDRLGADLIDILTARTTAASKAVLELSQRDLNPSIHGKHDKSIVQHETAVENHLEDTPPRQGRHFEQRKYLACSRDVQTNLTGL